MGSESKGAAVIVIFRKKKNLIDSLMGDSWLINIQLDKIIFFLTHVKLKRLRYIHLMSCMDIREVYKSNIKNQGSRVFKLF